MNTKILKDKKFTIEEISYVLDLTNDRVEKIVNYLEDIELSKTVEERRSANPDGFKTVSESDFLLKHNINKNKIDDFDDIEIEVPRI
jgi:hypothetical protein